MIPLDIRGSLRRVDVLGLGIRREGAPAERDDPSLDVADGEDQAVAEAVVLSAPALARHRQTGLDDVGGQGPLRDQMAAQRFPVVGGVAEAEPLDGLLVEAAPGKVSAAAVARVAGQQLPEEGQGQTVDLEHALAIVAALLPRGGQGNTEPRREGLDGLAEVQLVVELDELEDVAAGLAAEAVEQLALGIDRKRGRFFLVKRTEPLEPATRPLQGNVIRDDLNDIARSANGFDEVRCKRSTHL